MSGRRLTLRGRAHELSSIFDAEAIGEVRPGGREHAHADFLSRRHRASHRLSIRRDEGDEGP